MPEDRNPSLRPDHDFPKCHFVWMVAGRIVVSLVGWQVRPPPRGIRKAIFTAAPHTSNWDFPLAIFGMWAMHLKPRWLGKSSLFEGWRGPLMRALGGVPVDRSSAHGLVETVVSAFAQADRMLLLIPVEGTRSRKPYWKSGFYWMAREANIPVVLGYLDYERKIIGAEKLLHLTGDVHVDMDAVRMFYSDKTAKFPDQVSEMRLRQEDG